MRDGWKEQMEDLKQKQEINDKEPKKCTKMENCRF
jgi:hypothetical protein